LVIAAKKKKIHEVILQLKKLNIYLLTSNEYSKTYSMVSLGWDWAALIAAAVRF